MAQVCQKSESLTPGNSGGRYVYATGNCLAGVAVSDTDIPGIREQQKNGEDGRY
jgi:hypothetical protein